MVAGDGHTSAIDVTLGTTSEVLAQQVRILQAGLGVYCTIGRPKRHLKEPKYRPIYHVRWYLKPTRRAAIKRPETWVYPVDVCERVDKEVTVYDIQVAEDESFVTTGGTFHNCTIAWMYMRRFMDLQIEDDEDTEELDLFNPKNLQGANVGYYG